MVKNIFDKIMHFVIHNGFMFTVGVMGMTHATLLVIMLIAGVMPLVWFNILSVVVYIFCTIMCRFGHVMPAYVSIILEVTAYTVISTHYLGLRSGTYCFLFSIVPIIIYFGTYLFKGMARWRVVLMLVINFLTFTTLYAIYCNKMPVYDIDPGIRIVLVFFSAFVMVFSTIFYNTIYIYSAEREVINLEEKNKQLSVDASEDSLTHLLNRRAFMPLIEQFMNDEQKKHFCLAFCDIDNFKRINDSFGHDAGDEVLRHITKIIRREMQGCDICRWGGEEIVILMRDYDMTVARAKMEYLRKNIEANPTAFYNRQIYTTITIGLEENRDIYKVPDDIIKVADGRMYYGKKNGKNILVYEDL